jgi:hypothetical protein
MRIEGKAAGTSAAALVAAALLLTGCAAAGASPFPAAAPSTPGPAIPSAAPALPLGPDPSLIVELPQPTTAAPPVQVDVDPLGSIPVVGVGVAADGQAQIPEDVSQVGWYRYGSAPGEGDGAVVLMGHRDSRGGAGALFDLPSVPVDSTITVTDADGAVHRYQVTSNDSISKQVVPLAELFVREGPAQLVLISCGGAYIKEQGGYLDNVVVRASKF